MRKLIGYVVITLAITNGTAQNTGIHTKGPQAMASAKDSHLLLSKPVRKMIAKRMWYAPDKITLRIGTIKTKINSLEKS